MKPLSNTAMIQQPQRRFSSFSALLVCSMLLGGCSMFAGKPSTPAAQSGSAAPSAGSANTAASNPAAPKPVDKGDPDARFKAALELMKQGQAQDAETALTDLVKDFPQYSGPLTELGLIYAKSKRFDLAASAFAKATSNNSDNAVAYNWQGILYRQANDYSRAEQAYKHALSANSNYANAHLNLGILYDVYLKRPSDALQQYQEYQRLGGADDLRVLVWVADLEKAQNGSQPAAAPAVVSAPAAAVTPAPKEKKP